MGWYTPLLLFQVNERHAPRRSRYGDQGLAERAACHCDDVSGGRISNGDGLHGAGWACGVEYDELSADGDEEPRA